jgi:hypothetical protein
MKKTLMIAGTILLLFTATLNAQTDSVPVLPAKPATDQWNNYNPEKYKLQPMPAALTIEKTFPVIGKYNLTDKDGAASNATITLDETNKGIVWVEGLPQGKIKAFLRKVPGIYIIPVQKSADEKDIAAGVLIFDKTTNTLDVCIGCAYNNDDPASAFTTPAEPVVEEPIATKTKTKKATAKTKVKPVKTWKYSGSKITEESTASVAPMQ